MKPLHSKKGANRRTNATLATSDRSPNDRPKHPKGIDKVALAYRRLLAWHSNQIGSHFDAFVHHHASWLRRCATAQSGRAAPCIASASACAHTERPAYRKDFLMTLCPIAIVAGCKKCPAFSICPLKSVIGDTPAKSDALPPSGKAGAGKSTSKRSKR